MCIFLDRFPNDEVSIVWDDIAVNLFSKIKTNEFHLANISSHVEIDIRLSGKCSQPLITILVSILNIRFYFINNYIFQVILALL